MRRVILESPFAGRGLWPLSWWRRRRNIAYARRCVRDSLSMGEAPIASHLLYTQPGILREGLAAERQWGIDAGLDWGDVSEATVVYIDRGISGGMAFGVRRARAEGRPVQYRALCAATALEQLRKNPTLDISLSQPVGSLEWKAFWLAAAAIRDGHREAEIVRRPEDFPRAARERQRTVSIVLEPAIPAKQGRNDWPSQVTERPGPPAPSTVRKPGTNPR